MIGTIDEDTVHYYKYLAKGPLVNIINQQIKNMNKKSVKQTEFKIEKNIAIPGNVQGPKKGENKYPFAQMKIGDSFLFPGKASSIYATAYAWKKAKQKAGFKWATNWTYLVRKEGSGARIWRTK